MLSKIIKSALLLSIFCIPVLSHGLGRMEENMVSVTDIQGKIWKLEEVRTGQNAVRINAAGGNQVYTIRFEAERIDGVGAPNRYFGPWTDNGGNSLSIGLVGSTMMASLFERDDLKEQEYFNFLGKVFKWELRNGKLELYTLNENNAEAVLIYTE